jgi:hypothetical protein
MDQLGRHGVRKRNGILAKIRLFILESRLRNHDVGNNCLMTIDGTDFRILQKGAATKGNAFASHKYARKSALRYERGWTSSRGTWCGSKGRTLWVSIPALLF